MPLANKYLRRNSAPGRRTDGPYGRIDQRRPHGHGTRLVATTQADQHEPKEYPSYATNRIEQTDNKIQNPEAAFVRLDDRVTTCELTTTDTGLEEQIEQQTKGQLRFEKMRIDRLEKLEKAAAAAASQSATTTGAACNPHKTVVIACFGRDTPKEDIEIVARKYIERARLGRELLQDATCKLESPWL